MAVFFGGNNLLKKPGGDRGGVTGSEGKVAIGCIFVETAAAAASDASSSNGDGGCDGDDKLYDCDGDDDLDDTGGVVGAGCILDAATLDAATATSLALAIAFALAVGDGAGDPCVATDPDGDCGDDLCVATESDDRDGDGDIIGDGDERGDACNSNGAADAILAPLFAAVAAAAIDPNGKLDLVLGWGVSGDPCVATDPDGDARSGDGDRGDARSGDGDRGDARSGDLDGRDGDGDKSNTLAGYRGGGPDGDCGDVFGAGDLVGGDGDGDLVGAGDAGDAGD